MEKQQPLLTPDEFVSNCLKDGKIQVPCLEGHVFDPDTYRGAAKWLIEAINGNIKRVTDSVVKQQLVQQQCRVREEGLIRAEAALAKNKARNKASALGWDMPQPFAEAQAQTAENDVLRKRKEIPNPTREFLEVDSSHYDVTGANRHLIIIQHTALPYIVALVKFFKNNSLNMALKKAVTKQHKKLKNVHFESLENVINTPNNHDDEYELVAADQIKMMIKK